MIYLKNVKIYLLLLSVLLVGLIVYSNSSIKNQKQSLKEEKNLKKMKCYTDRNFDNKSGLFKIDDILLSERKPKKGKSIFFHETTCSRTGILKLNARQACAIESAALLNPNFDIFVLFASPVARDTHRGDGVDVDILEAIDNYENIYFRNVNIWSYAHNTPIEEWLEIGILFESHYIETHVADLLRYITLWRWGGTHLDLDVLLIKTLDNITQNFVGAESNDFLNNAILNFDYHGIGHEIITRLLKALRDYYEPETRSSLGPYLTTAVFKEFCKTDTIEIMTPARCSGFKIFDPKIFYAVRYQSWNIFFLEDRLEEAMRLTKESIAIHIWSFMSKNSTVEVGSKVAYGIYADKYCPNVYSSCGKFF